MPYDNELFKAQFGIPGGGPPSSGIQGPAEGFWGTLEYLNRPQYAVSEAVQAGLEGEGIEGIGAIEGNFSHPIGNVIEQDILVHIRCFPYPRIYFAPRQR